MTFLRCALVASGGLNFVFVDIVVFHHTVMTLLHFG